MRTFVALLLTIGLHGTAIAHGGGLDTCGGHQDRKRGGYHVHRVWMYCNCHPEQPVCKDQKQRNEKQTAR